MVSSSILADNLYNLFFSWPTEAKPPIEKIPFYNEDGELEKVEIQMALAGFRKEDINIECDDKLLYISGSNANCEEISKRFTCSFSHKIAYTSQLNMSDSEIIFENGFLRIIIPAIEVKKTRMSLFGTRH